MYQIYKMLLWGGGALLIVKGSREGKYKEEKIYCTYLHNLGGEQSIRYTLKPNSNPSNTRRHVV
jgi:hypothetical protein